MSHLQIEPTMAIADLGAELRIRVTATFDDGSVIDASDLAVYTSTDSAAVAVESSGKLTIHRRGRHSVIVRFLSEVQTIQVTVPLAEQAVDLRDAPRLNWIDDEILDTLETLRLSPSPVADNATMLRRVHLDLTGRLPTSDEVRRYLSDKDAGRFTKLVDRLLQSSEFTEYWTYKLAKLLRIQAQPNESAGAKAFHSWVRDQLRRGAAWSEMAIDMLTAVGDTHEHGPANFYRVAGDARKQAEYVSEVLMGVRLRCANCHNHPLDRWTQDDYHGLAAIFARIERGRNIRVKSRGKVMHPGTGEAAVPRIPGDRFVAESQDGRRELAVWLSSGSNPYFAKAMVNRIWKSLMGRGLIEPTDDLRATNPATHPRLLERLAGELVDHEFNLRHTIRTIVTSAAYARDSAATETNRADDRYYSHWLPKPLEAEVLADAITDVTGIADQYGGQPLGTRAVALFNPRTPAPTLDILGRCAREDSCESAPGGSSGLSTRLHMINGPLLNRRIAGPEGRLHRQIGSGESSAKIVESFYLSALGRFPRDDEIAFWAAQLGDSGSGRTERLEDFVWSLLNCRAFTTNQ